MKLLLILTTFCFMVSCNIKPPSYWKISDKEKTADKILARVARKLKLEKDLYPFGSGGQMMYEIKMLALSFNYYKPLDVKKGRELLVTAVNEFVDAINADEKIRPYLYKYPFKAKNVEISIFIYNSDRYDVSKGELSVISIVGGVLDYDINNPSTSRLMTIHKESFEEALKRIDARTKIEKQSVPKSA